MISSTLEAFLLHHALHDHRPVHEHEHVDQKAEHIGRHHRQHARAGPVPSRLVDSEGLQRHVRLDALHDLRQIVDSVSLQLFRLQNLPDPLGDRALQIERRSLVRIQADIRGIGQHVGSYHQIAVELVLIFPQPFLAPISRYENRLPVALQLVADDSAAVHDGDPLHLIAAKLHDERRSDHQPDQQQRRENRRQNEAFCARAD